MIGFDVVGDPVSQACSNPETWTKTGFQYKKEYDTEQGRVKSRIVGPNSHKTVYEMPFNEKNLKELFDKRITPDELKLMGQKRMLTLSFAVKDERNNVVRDVQDATGIPSQDIESNPKDFDYLANSDYITPQQKAEARQNAIDMGLLPREAQAPSQPEQITKPPTGTYS